MQALSTVNQPIRKRENRGYSQKPRRENRSNAQLLLQWNLQMPNRVQRQSQNQNVG